MNPSKRQIVEDRANLRCEYCRLSQRAAPFLRFHVEHIESRQHVDDDALDNLALACPDCNRYKGPNLTTFVPGTRAITELFHPRRDAWEKHFVLNDCHIVGLTPKGQATVDLLRMNSPERIEMRAELDWS